MRQLLHPILAYGRRPSHQRAQPPGRSVGARPGIGWLDSSIALLGNGAFPLPQPASRRPHPRRRYVRYSSGRAPWIHRSLAARRTPQGRAASISKKFSSVSGAQSAAGMQRARCRPQSAARRILWLAGSGSSSAHHSRSGRHVDGKATYLNKVNPGPAPAAARCASALF
ncbi:hypothetical protein ZWY2020_035597 [Hordeum vulgare]|nr:hypothetical protein ZWY2020_035597 [Hordeum vulgare]